jgi:hypothetical protein
LLGVNLRQLAPRQRYCANFLLEAFAQPCAPSPIRPPSPPCDALTPAKAFAALVVLPLIFLAILSKTAPVLSSPDYYGFGLDVFTHGTFLSGLCDFANAVRVADFVTTPAARPAQIHSAALAAFDASRRASSCWLLRIGCTAVIRVHNTIRVYNTY